MRHQVILKVLLSVFLAVSQADGPILQGGWGGWPRGNGKKLSSSQARFTHQNDRESLLYMLVGPKMWIIEVNVTVSIDL